MTYIGYKDTAEVIVYEEIMELQKNEENSFF